MQRSSSDLQLLRIFKGVSNDEYKKIISTVIAAATICVNFSVLSPVSYADDYTFEATNAGHSGGASGTGLFIGAVGDIMDGTADRAPFISGVTANNSTEVASARIGALEFQVDSSIDPETIVNATLNVYVNGVNENLKSDWMLLAAYETDNPSLTYSVGGMDQNEYPARNTYLVICYTLTYVIGGL